MDCSCSCNCGGHHSRRHRRYRHHRKGWWNLLSVEEETEELEKFKEHLEKKLGDVNKRLELLKG